MPEKYKCKICGKEISEEEFERNNSYCDDCEDDYWDEIDMRKKKREEVAT